MTYKIDKTIVLIGLMGAGKTTVGRRLANALKVKFCDSDDEITKAAGCSIPDIFEIHGEAIFRDLEEKVITRLLNERETGLSVLATGGGAWINQNIRKIIKEKAISIWLKADLEVLLERVSRRNTRPLLEKGNKRAILSKLMEERYPLYEEADIIIESGEESHSKIVAKIMEALEKHERR